MKAKAWRHGAHGIWRDSTRTLCALSADDGLLHQDASGGKEPGVRRSATWSRLAAMLPGLAAFAASAAVQNLEVEYASAEDAREAEVTVSPLSEGKRFAFTERWDDTNPRHLDMAKAMEPIGVKATFYFNGGRGERFAPIMRELVRRGHSIGNHTMTHRHQPGLLPFCQFRDIMECRIDLECASQSPVVAYTTPHGVYTMETDDEARVRVGRSLLNAGLISSPEGNQKVCETYSLSPREWFGSHYFWANDKEPNLATYTAGLRAATNAMLSVQSPFGRHVTLGTHTLQTDEGLAHLREMLTPLARTDDVWLANENEWAAARKLSFETRITRLDVRGNRAVYAVERPDPRDVGADVGPFFRFSRKPTAFRLSEISVEARTPETFGRLGEGVLKADPGLRQFTLELFNDTDAEWSSARVILRLPSNCEPGVQTVEAGKVAIGETKRLTLRADCTGWEPLRDGDFYAAAQIDLVRAGRPERRWADVRLPRPAGCRPFPRDTVVSVGPVASADCPGTDCLARMSELAAELKPIAGKAWRRGIGTGMFHPRYVTLAHPKTVAKEFKGCPAVWACEFDADVEAHGDEWLLTGRIYGYETKREMFLNGKRLGELGMTDAARPLKLRNGRNRLICKFGYISDESFNHEIMIVSRKDGAEVAYRASQTSDADGLPNKP